MWSPEQFQWIISEFNSLQIHARQEYKFVHILNKGNWATNIT